MFGSASRTSFFEGPDLKNSASRSSVGASTVGDSSSSKRSVRTLPPSRPGILPLLERIVPKCFQPVTTIEPVLAKDPNCWLGRPGAPPRDLERRLEADIDAWSVVAAQPSLSRRPLTQTGSARSLARSEMGSTRESVRDKNSSLGQNEMSELDFSSETASQASEYLGRRPSPCALAETMRGRSIWGKGHIFRGGVEEALDDWDEDILGMARFRVHNSRQVQEKNRKQAVKWRKGQEQQREVHEQRMWDRDQDARRKTTHIEKTIELPTVASLLTGLGPVRKSSDSSDEPSSIFEGKRSSLQAPPDIPQRQHHKNSTGSHHRDSNGGHHPDSTGEHNSGDDPTASARSHKMPGAKVLKRPLKDRIQILRRRHANRIRDKEDEDDVFDLELENQALAKYAASHTHRPSLIQQSLAVLEFQSSDESGTGFGHTKSVPSSKLSAMPNVPGLEGRNSDGPPQRRKSGGDMLELSRRGSGNGDMQTLHEDAEEKSISAISSAMEEQGRVRNGQVARFDERKSKDEVLMIQQPRAMRAQTEDVASEEVVSPTKKARGGLRHAATMRVDGTAPPKNEATIKRDREMALLLEAFARHDGDHSGTLDQPELRVCLTELGLRGKTNAERVEIRRILWNIDELQISFEQFVTQVVPEARQTLKTMRREQLLQFFDEVNVHHSDKVSVEEVVTTLRRHGTIVSDIVRDDAIRLFSCQANKPFVPDSRLFDMLGKEDFVMFVATFRERTDRDHVFQFQQIAKQLGMEETEQEKWRNDLVSFHGMFHEYDPCSGKFGCASGLLSQKQVVTVVRESGYMPKTSTGQAMAMSLIQEHLSAEGTANFSDFLKIMQGLREPDRQRLRKTFHQFALPGLGVMTWNKLPDALVEAGISPKSSDEKYEVRALADDVDLDGAEVLCAEDFAVLCQNIAAKLRMIQREKERQYVLSAGWNEQMFIELRDAFQIFDEDMSEVLERDELMKAVELLKGQYWQSSSNINLMFMGCGIDPSKKIEVNFLTFLRMLKMLDESENRRQQGANMGFSRDRTDKLYTAFQALDSEGSEALSTVSKTILDNVLTDVSRSLPKMQLGEVLRVLHQEPMQVEFNAFLRVMRVMEGMLDNDLELAVQGMLEWCGVAMHGETVEHEDEAQMAKSSTARSQAPTTTQRERLSTSDARERKSSADI